MTSPVQIRLLLLHCPAPLSGELGRQTTVYAADDARAAIATLGEVEVDIAVVDHENAGDDALDFIRLLRTPRMDKIAALQVIFLVATSRPDEIRGLVRQGVDHIMVKPLSPRMVIESAEQLLAQPTPQITAGSYRGPDRRRIPLPEFLGDERRGK